MSGPLTNAQLAEWCERNANEMEEVAPKSPNAEIAVAMLREAKIHRLLASRLRVSSGAPPDGRKG